MLRVPRPRTAALVALVLVAACGGDDGDDVVGGGGGDLSMVLSTSGVRWIDGDEYLDEVDVSADKIDPTLLGVEVVWEYTVEGADEPIDELSVRPELETGVVIDEQSTDNAASLGPGQVGLLDRAVGELRLVPTPTGFRVEWLIGSVLGASDLRSQEEFDQFLAEAGIDPADAPIQYQFVQDDGEQGVLDYRIPLRGSVEVDGSEIEIDDAVEFVAIESDPAAEAVENDQSAVAAAEAADAVEAGECDPLVFAADDTAISVTAADGTPIVAAELPEGWRGEISEGDVCDRTSISLFTDADERFSDLQIIVFPAVGETAAEFAERRIADWNIGFDDEGNETPLGPGDDFYRAYEPVEPTTVAGREGVILVGTEDLGGGSTLTSYEVATIVGDRVVIVNTSYFDGDDSVVTELLPPLLDAMTLGG